MNRNDNIAPISKVMTPAKTTPPLSSIDPTAQSNAPKRANVTVPDVLPLKISLTHSILIPSCPLFLRQQANKKHVF
jgi:hypothetical protein